MKRTFFIILAVLLCISIFAGCEYLPIDYEDNTGEIHSDSQVKRKISSVDINSIPNGYEYQFKGEDADAIIEYLSSLNLTSDFPESFYECTGMTWEISIVFENGDIFKVYHIANIFIKTEDGPHYKMEFDEASKIDSLINSLSNKAVLEQDTWEYGTEARVKYDADGYSILMTVAKDEIKVSDEYVRYMYAVDQELLRAADKSLWSKIPYINEGYVCYLTIDDEGYLCIDVEVIVHIDDTETPDCIDHKHLFFSERISRSPVKKDIFLRTVGENCVNFKMKQPVSLTIYS